VLSNCFSPSTSCRYASQRTMGSGVGRHTDDGSVTGLKPPSHAYDKASSYVSTGGDSCGSRSLASQLPLRETAAHSHDGEGQGEGIWVTFSDTPRAAATCDRSTGEGHPLSGPCATADVSRLLASLPQGVLDSPEACGPLDPNAPLEDSRCCDPPRRLFTVELHRHSPVDSLGIMVVGGLACDIVVTRIKEGVLQRWNEAHPHEAVQPGDCIIEANGVRGSFHDRMVVMSTSTVLRLIVAKGERAADSIFDAAAGEAAAAKNVYRWRISVKKVTVLGLEIDGAPGCPLTICAVKEGPVNNWNATAPPAFIVAPGDVIEEVNGVVANREVLLGLIRTNEDLLLGFVRRQ